MIFEKFYKASVSILANINNNFNEPFFTKARFRLSNFVVPKQFFHFILGEGEVIQVRIVFLSQPRINFAVTT